MSSIQTFDICNRLAMAEERAQEALDMMPEGAGLDDERRRLREAIDALNAVWEDMHRRWSGDHA
jgi:alkanesulfonate monooxygenase SsuD/methylene tetrahydromethanopterin reductase-like flavin-dependent oxidoreductase (luciferase family)